MRLGVAGAMVAGVYRPGDVDVDASSGRIAAVGLAGPGRGLAIPGLIDLQVNGFAGVDFQLAQADDYRPAAQALARSGVLAFQPTLITGAPGRMLAALEEAAKAQAHHGGARILGVHLEGPFLSPRRSGTHPIDLLRSPGPALARQLLDAGPVTEITIAPELPGALRLIDLAVRRGVLVSLGHSDATAEHAHAAVDHGARMVTHVFNAMRPFAHRDPGIVGVALTRRELTVGLIADPSHVAPDAVRLAFAAAAGRVALVSDALAAAGQPDGRYRLGDVEFETVHGVARRSDGTLVGSTLTLIEAVRNAHGAGVPLEAAVGAATVTPAALFADADLGLLRPGDYADAVVLDDGLAIRSVLQGGTALEC